MKKYNIKLLSLKCSKLVLYTSLFFACFGVFIAIFQLLPQNMSFIFRLSVILAIGVCIVVPLKYVLSKTMLRDYVFELDEDGISIYQGGKPFYEAKWGTIPRFLLGEEDKDTIVIKLLGKKKLNITATFFDPISEISKLHEVMEDIIHFTKTNKSTGRRVWYIISSKYKMYKNPLYNDRI